MDLGVRVLSIMAIALKMVSYLLFIGFIMKLGMFYGCQLLLLINYYKVIIIQLQQVKITNYLSKLLIPNCFLKGLLIFDKVFCLTAMFRLC